MPFKFCSTMGIVWKWWRNRLLGSNTSVCSSCHYHECQWYGKHTVWFRTSKSICL